MQKKKKARDRSTQELMGVTAIRDYGISTPHGDMLFNVLSYLSDRLLTDGNTVAALDELYLWLGEPVAIEYIRNCMKRVRKKESAMMLASQNLEDFDREGVL